MDVRRVGDSFLLRIALLFTLVGSLAACAPKILEAKKNTTSGGSAQQSAEAEYCSTVTPYAGGVALTGQANFYYRVVDASAGLSGDPVSTGIPYAEVMVKNAAGAVVQCSTTSNSGALSLDLPAGNATYTLYVMSRSITTKIKASVNEDFYANAPYSISKTFTVSGPTVNIGNVNAYARVSESAKIEGAAFNILFRIYQANEYLRTTLSDSTFVAPKVNVYWKKGHNPYNYFGHSSPLISFYSPGTGNLFILGGDGGDVKAADTDHFDNSVILHEYAHFLEDKYNKSESPGGSHNGNFIVDARLAWSEGWANFFQGAVLNSFDPTWKYYVDTKGFKSDTVEGSGGGAGLSIKVELTISGSSGICASTPSPFHLISCDPVGTNGEGTFREMSISRFLFKSILSTGDGGAGVPFSSMWTVFSAADSAGVPVGLASTQLAFKNIGLFNKLLRANLTTAAPTTLTDWDTLRSDEKQNDTTLDYANNVTLVTDNTCANNKTMAPVQDAADPFDGSARSNLLRSNDFYFFNYTGAGGYLRIEYTNGASNSTDYRDLDLYLYNKDHIFQESGAATNGTIARSSAAPWSIEQGVEQISLSGLTAGKYLIDVKAYTYGKTGAQLTSGTIPYKIKYINGATTEDVCPVN